LRPDHDASARPVGHAIPLVAVLTSRGSTSSLGTTTPRFCLNPISFPADYSDQAASLVGWRASFPRLQGTMFSVTPDIQYPWGCKFRLFVYSVLSCSRPSGPTMVGTVLEPVRSHTWAVPSSKTPLDGSHLPPRLGIQSVDPERRLASAGATFLLLAAGVPWQSPPPPLHRTHSWYQHPRSLVRTPIVSAPAVTASLPILRPPNAPTTRTSFWRRFPPGFY